MEDKRRENREINRERNEGGRVGIDEKRGGL
jgi:hypothetical protein